MTCKKNTRVHRRWVGQDGEGIWANLFAAQVLKKDYDGLGRIDKIFGPSLFLPYDPRSKNIRINFKNTPILLVDC